MADIKDQLISLAGSYGGSGHMNLPLAEVLKRAAAEIERLRAVTDAARHMPRATPRSGGAGTMHDFKIEAGRVWDLDRAFLALDAIHQQKEDATK